MTVYIGPNGERRVDVGRLPRSEAKQLRRLARGKRGGGRMSTVGEAVRHRRGDKVPVTTGGRAPRRVQLSREPGWKTSPSTIRVDAYSRWGNPFEGEYRSVNKFVAFLLTSPDRVYVRDGKTTVYPSDEAIKQDLGGYDLGCFCDLGEGCHADILIKIANGRRWPRRRANRSPQWSQRPAAPALTTTEGEAHHDEDRERGRPLADQPMGTADPWSPA